MCGFEEFFEVLGTLPLQTAETDVTQSLQGSISHIASLGVCSLQDSVSCNTHYIRFSRSDLLFCQALPPSFSLVFAVLIFWEHPVCVFNVVGHRLFSLRPLTIPALLLV